MKRVMLLIFFAGISCTQNRIVHYEYDNVVITRVDKSAESFFYYGICDDKSNPCPKSYIRAKYNGFDGSMGGYLIFHPNDKVEILRMFRFFEDTGHNSFLYLSEYDDNYALNRFTDSIRGDYRNRAWISDILSEEKEQNDKNNSKVMTVY
ncbi:MAG: hypothetical protein AAF992_21700 [Bacteroidota bacterium]